jgi:predicted DNA-binding transcriptional regulator YafY
MKTQEFKWEVKKRLEEIECCLWWMGKLGRVDLMSKFGISPQQASADISLYQKLAPGNAEFNRSVRQYEPTKAFSPKFIDGDAADYTEWRSGASEEVMVIPMPLRNTPLPTLQPVTLAIHQRKSLQIEYQSTSSVKMTHRRITPHTIVFDGYRYHVRAYCHSKEEFRDFVLGRITKAGEFSDAGKNREKDEAWNTLIILRIVAHPKLSASQRIIIERDFQMVKGELQLRVRLAMLHYTLTQLRLDRFAEDRTPAEQQIILLNPEVLSYRV